MDDQLLHARAHQRAEGGAHDRARLVRQRLVRSVHVAVGVRGGVAALAGGVAAPAGGHDHRRQQRPIVVDAAPRHFFEGDDRAARRVRVGERAFVRRHKQLEVT